MNHNRPDNIRKILARLRILLPESVFQGILESLTRFFSMRLTKPIKKLSKALDLGFTYVFKDTWIKLLTFKLGQFG